MLGRIAEAMDGFSAKGIRWRAKTLTDRGPHSQEKQYGADFAGVLEIDVPGYNVKKGFLAQAKLLRADGMSDAEFRRMVGQCQQMLELSPASFVFHQSRDGIRVIPAIAVVGSSGPEVAFDPNGVYSRKIGRFYEEHFGCFVGDGAISEPTIETLERLRARELLYLAARSQ